MTLNDALLLRDSHLHLIGKTTEKIPFIISAIIVVPDDNYVDFMNHYYNLKNELTGELTPSELLLKYHSKSYSVKVISEQGHMGEDEIYGDLSSYI